MLDFTCPGGYFPMISTPSVAIMLLPEKQITILNWTSVTMMGDASMLPHNQGLLPGLQRLDLKGKNNDKISISVMHSCCLGNSRFTAGAGPPASLWFWTADGH